MLGTIAAQLAAASALEFVAIDSYDSSGQIDRNVFIDPGIVAAKPGLLRQWLALANRGQGRAIAERARNLRWRRPSVVADLLLPAALGAVSQPQADFYRAAGIRTAVIFPLWAREEFVGVLALGGADLRLYSQADLESLGRMASVVAAGIKTVQLLREVNTSKERERASFLESIERLAAAAEARDTFTGQHLTHIRRHVEVLGEVMGLESGRVKRIAQAAALHDVGKISVPDAILLKPGLLSEQERNLMKQHTVVGERLLYGSQLELAREVARHHHERWDGTGYPDGRSETDIPLSARIVAVADVYDALTSHRPYKRAWPAEQAYEEVRSASGTQFDPEIVEAFEQAWRSGTLTPSAHDPAPPS
jgi:response regulator RpfG family c-di-GMP phosphodiesterase